MLFVVIIIQCTMFTLKYGCCVTMIVITQHWQSHISSFFSSVKW